MAPSGPIKIKVGDSTYALGKGIAKKIILKDLIESEDKEI